MSAVYLAVGAAGFGAVVLAVLALVNLILARRAERRHPPRGRFVVADGIRLHYLDRGAGEPIVLLHGNGATADDFEISGVFDRLARDHRVIAFDRPGFGHSARPRRGSWTAAAQADLTRKALRQIGIRKPVILGHSWGTLVALSLALDDPEETAALILLSGFYIPIARGDVALMGWSGVPLLNDILAYTLMPLIGRLVAPPFIRWIFAPNSVTERFRKEFPLGLTVRPTQMKASADDTRLMIPSAASLQPRHGELRMKVVIMAGADDRVVATDPQSGQLHADVPGSEFRKIAGVGHMIHHVVPDVVAEAARSAERR